MKPSECGIVRWLSVIPAVLAAAGLLVFPSALAGDESPGVPVVVGRFGSVPPASPPSTAVPRSAAGPVSPSADNRDRLLAGHLLRRIGFGPTPQEVARVLQMGREAYIAEQLNPGSIDDSKALAKLPPPGKGYYDDWPWIRRWYTRMTYSRRQLLERMTLIWHEHFATSNEKVSSGCHMHEQEEMLRRNALGSFRDMLIDVTRDQAMLAWLDNDWNNGRNYDDEGNLIPPNENYARELLQLFALGTDLLHMDGTAVLDDRGVAVPAYTEADVKEVARALTGWHIRWGKCNRKAAFEWWLHDPDPKTFLGVTIKGRDGKNGAKEVQDVVGAIMKHPSTAPFISRMLIQKLATETPTPGYVERTAAVFKRTNGNIKETVRAILADDEFHSDAVVRNMLKEPVEHLIAPLRALGAHTRGGSIIDWTYYAGQLVYYPPSVFSFYPPGRRDTLVNTALLTVRDNALDRIVAGDWDTWFDAKQMIKNHRLKTPEQAVDHLSEILLVAPLAPDVRADVIEYMGGEVSEERFRGAAWLIMCSPDYQRN